jgi:hypothetical protein
MKRLRHSVPPVVYHRPITYKMQVFAEHVAVGQKLADAYRAAFNTGTMLPKTVRDEASRLAKNPGVAAAIVARKAEIDREHHVLALRTEDRIWQHIWALVESQSVAPSIRVRALGLAARLCGMFKRPEDLAPAFPAQIEAELSLRLRAYTA